MTPLPPLDPRFKHLDEVGLLPPLLAVARTLIGTTEAPGVKDNPVILGWAKELDLNHVYVHDSQAWCGLFAGICAHRAGVPLWKDSRPLDILWALNWSKFGLKVGRPMLGDIITLQRHSRDGKLIGGHVTQYVAEDNVVYYCLGGNQGDTTSIIPIAKDRVNSVTRVVTALPCVKPYFVKPTGQSLGASEA